MKTIKVTARRDGTVTEKTLRKAFLLEDDVPVALFRDEIALECRSNGDDDVFELKRDWDGATFEILWEEERRSRPATPVEFGPRQAKRRKNELKSELPVHEDFQKVEQKAEVPVDQNLASIVQKHALYYTKKDGYKRCAIPLTRKFAATFRHGENQNIEKGDKIMIRSCFHKELEIPSRAIKFIDKLDAIILQSEGADFCDENLICDSVQPRIGMQYLLMGFSIMHDSTNHQSFSTGIIAADLARKKRYIGTSGSFKGDSGGGCWSEDGRLIGMQVAVEKVPHTKDNNGRPASPATGGRCCIVPARSILDHIEELMPPETYVEWEE